MIWRPPLWMRLALGGALLAGGLPARSAEPAVLTRAAAVHALDPAEAERAQPVLLTGVVTHYNRLLADGFFLQDDTDGVYVRLGDTKPELLPGDRVEIAGTTATGDFAPVVVLRALTKLGRAELPAAVPVSLADLASGRYDSRRVEVRGTVWAATPASPRGDSHLTLQLRIDGQDLLIGVNRYSPASLQLADARVRVRGVAAGIFSRQRQILAPVVVAESDEQIEILEAPPPPDALPVQTIRMIFGHNPVTPTDRRVRIRGQVLAQPVAGWLAVRDEHSGLFVSVTPGTDLQPGDLVELTGFPSIREKNLSLTHAVARRHGHTPLPPAKTGTITEGLASHCERFRIEGTLTGPPALGAGSWVLNVRAGPAEYEALVPATGGPAPESWRAGARVAVTGITEPFSCRATGWSCARSPTACGCTPGPRTMSPSSRPHPGAPRRISCVCW